MPPVAFVPNTAAPTHLGNFRNGPFGTPLTFNPAGMPFLSDLFNGLSRYVVEIAFGADINGDSSLWTWVDVTDDVTIDFRSVDITIGPRDDPEQMQPATCSFQLDNTSGNYTRYDARSIYYPDIQLNTPVRIRASIDGSRGSSTWYILFQGEASGFTPDFGGTTGKVAVVNVEASGILRRLQQGKTPAKSALYRTICGSDPVGYWPLSDGTSATFGSAGCGGKPITATGTWLFGETSSPVGGAGSVKRNSVGATLTAPVSVTGSSSFRVDVCIQEDATNATQTTLLIQMTNSSVSLNLGLGSGIGNWHHHRIEIYNSFGTALLDWYVDGVQTIFGNSLFVSYGDPVNLIFEPGTVANNFDHLSDVAVWSPRVTTNVYDAFLGHPNETVSSRLTRMCAEEDVPLTIVGSANDTMGTQATDTFINLIRECQAADGGSILDGLGQGITYVSRAAAYNIDSSMTFDASNGEIDSPFTPRDDDQRIRNFVKVERKNGAFAISEDVDGPLGTAIIGNYDTSITVNHKDDTQLANRANWEVNKGTIVGFRYPTLNVDFRTVPTQLVNFLTAPVRPRIDLTNLTSILSQHPTGTVSLLLEGYSLSFDNFNLTMQGNCSLFEPWRLFEVGHVQTGRLDTAGAQLSQDASAGASLLWVVRNANTVQPWITTRSRPQDFPFDVEVNGIQVTVSAVASYLNANPYFEPPLNETSWLAVNGATIVASSAQFHEGTQSLLITPDGVTAVPQAMSESFAVVPGRSYTISSWVRSAAGGDTLKIAIFWYDVNDNFISSSEISAAPSAGVWTQYGPTAFVGLWNATHARLVTNNPGTPLASHSWRVDEFTVTDSITTQQFTVSPTIKAFHAGDSVKLYRPGRIAL